VVATVPPRKLQSFVAAAKRSRVAVTEIGVITKGKGARFFGPNKQQLRLARASFSHF
jgi:thiamine monophosphate kinase